MSSPIIIKKYANRRLYNTQTSSYVTHEDLCQLIREGNNFSVIDVKTDQDLTRSVLIQIIFEQEAKGYQILPTKFLHHIISFYGNDMMQFVPYYLEITMETFVNNQEKIKSFAQKTFSDYSPISQIDNLNKRNLKIWNKMFKLFVNPFND